MAQFYQDITDGNYAAWALGGDNLSNGVGYAAWVPGYSTTASITLNTFSQFGASTVYARLTATQTDGTVKTYAGTYTVSGGVIVAADIAQNVMSGTWAAHVRVLVDEALEIARQVSGPIPESRSLLFFRRTRRCPATR